MSSTHSWEMVCSIGVGVSDGAPDGAPDGALVGGSVDGAPVGGFVGAPDGVSVSVSVSLLSRKGVANWSSEMMFSVRRRRRLRPS